MFCRPRQNHPRSRIPPLPIKAGFDRLFFSSSRGPHFPPGRSSSDQSRLQSVIFPLCAGPPIFAASKAPLCNGPGRPLLPFWQFTFRELSPQATEGLSFHLSLRFRSKQALIRFSVMLCGILPIFRRVRRKHRRAPTSSSLLHLPPAAQHLVTFSPQSRLRVVPIFF